MEKQEMSNKLKNWGKCILNVFTDVKQVWLNCRFFKFLVTL